MLNLSISKPIPRAVMHESNIVFFSVTNSVRPLKRVNVDEVTSQLKLTPVLRNPILSLGMKVQQANPCSFLDNPINNYKRPRRWLSIDMVMIWVSSKITKSRSSLVFFFLGMRPPKTGVIFYYVSVEIWNSDIY